MCEDICFYTIYFADIITSGKLTIPLMYEFSVNMRVPCKFDHSKYPFGPQSCSFELGDYSHDGFVFIDDVYAYQQILIAPIRYDGPSNLDEYEVIKATRKYINEKLHSNEIRVTIQFRYIYEHHIINSFLPSTLISIVVYGTLFIPKENFNERIIISLTSQLVLLTMYEKSSSESVKTSYAKLLDVWFVGLMIFGFLIVMMHLYVRWHETRVRIFIRKRPRKRIRRVRRVTNIARKIRTVKIKGAYILQAVNKKLWNARLLFGLILTLFVTTYVAVAVREIRREFQDWEV